VANVGDKLRVHRGTAGTTPSSRLLLQRPARPTRPGTSTETTPSRPSTSCGAPTTWKPGAGRRAGKYDGWPPTCAQPANADVVSLEEIRTTRARPTTAWSLGQPLKKFTEAVVARAARSTVARDRSGERQGRRPTGWQHPDRVPVQPSGVVRDRPGATPHGDADRDPSWAASAVGVPAGRPANTPGTPSASRRG